MDYCEGFRDWHKCFRCEQFCTARCPLEGETMEERGLQLRRLSAAYHKDKTAGVYGKGVKEP